MAKIKNLFIGCPVQVKGNSEVGFVSSIDNSDNTAWITYPIHCGQSDGWRMVEDLKLTPFPDPNKVMDHIERFI